MSTSSLRLLGLQGIQFARPGNQRREDVARSHKGVRRTRVRDTPPSFSAGAPARSPCCETFRTYPDVIRAEIERTRAGMHATTSADARGVHGSGGRELMLKCQDDSTRIFRGSGG